MNVAFNTIHINNSPLCCVKITQKFQNMSFILKHKTNDICFMLNGALRNECDIRIDYSH